MPLDLHDRSRVSGSADPDDGVDIEVHSGLTYRPLNTPEDAAACFELQGDIWGRTFDRVPASLLRVATGVGGLAIGAFDDTGTLLGFVFSLAGLHNGEPIHWSHMLGVREAVRGAGVGRHLKEMQRAVLARRGIARVLWTFDPLQARNAHLNFNRLGVSLLDYVENMYGITASPLHHGLATDRLIVMLPTTPVVAEHAASNGASSANGSVPSVPVLTPFPRTGDIQVDLDDTAVPSVLIEIPADLQQVIAATPDVAGTWRLSTRASFQRALRRGYQVTGLRRDLTTNRAFYTLVGSSTADPNPARP
jgi:predicted GNAT superfamily acetyltransferase